jgi:group I intron endonuclease
MQVNYIYKATNKENNLVYIGSTTKSLEERIEDHLNKANNQKGSDFQEAIGTYGSESFVWEIIDIATSTDELANKEIKYIEEYNSKENGYNADKGGGFKKTIYQYNLDGTLNQTFENLTLAGESIQVRKQDISRACWSVNNTLGGFLWSYDYVESFTLNKDHRKKEVIQYDLDGNFLAKYVSASEASRLTGLSKTCITRCCRGEREQSGGFFWKYN